MKSFLLVGTHGTIIYYSTFKVLVYIRQNCKEANHCVYSQDACDEITQQIVGLYCYDIQCYEAIGQDENDDFEPSVLILVYVNLECS